MFWAQTDSREFTGSFSGMAAVNPLCVKDVGTSIWCWKPAQRLAAAACPIKGNVFQRHNWTSHNGSCFVSWHSHRRMQAKTQVLAFFWKRPVCFGPVRFAPCIDYNTGTQLAVAKTTGFGSTTAWSCRGAIFLQAQERPCLLWTISVLAQQSSQSSDLEE